MEPIMMPNRNVGMSLGIGKRMNPRKAAAVLHAMGAMRAALSSQSSERVV